jgi:CHC2 zinc finger
MEILIPTAEEIGFNQGEIPRISIPVDIKYLIFDKWIVEDPTGRMFTKKEFRVFINEQLAILNQWSKEVNDREDKERDTFPYEIDKESSDWSRRKILERERKLSYLLKRISTKVESKDVLDKDSARLVPITDFIEFDRAHFARCLWHEEDTGSMKYYPKNNTTHCFGCGKHGDVIDVVMKQFNVNFTSALKILLKK